MGFRPFVYHIATQLRLRGFVRNLGGEVEIEVDGAEQDLNEFLRRLRRDAPPLALIDDVHVDTDQAAQEEYSDFVILHSRQAHSGFQTVPPDTATCPLCLSEVFDPSNRRFNYAFTNCTACGPRFTIIRELPYDRRSTSMAQFKMCSACRAEYDEPTDRRFHAQPNACWRCGPQIWFAEPIAGAGAPTTRRTPDAQLADLELCVELLLNGKILAMKSLGGFHLVCDATNDQALLALRNRKRRNDKPFAVMFPNVQQARQYANIDETTEFLLSGGRRPIVLTEKGEKQLSEHVAPSVHQLGVMLPYTPLHHLLMARTMKPLIMTSGNVSDEPICIENDEALNALSGVADAFLLSDRQIESRFDDSVLRRARHDTIFIRRSRGFAPEPLNLHGAVEGCMLAVGAELKNTFCFAKDKHAFMSQHIGDMDDISSHEFFSRAVEKYGRLFDLEPDAVAHDLHPDYLSSRVALELAQEKNIPVYAVQHHHAHVVSCMVDNAISGPVIGVALDGTGYGDDETIWGGEILIADYASYERFGHFAPAPMAGMNAAARQPGRMLAAFGTKLRSSFIERRLRQIFADNQLTMIQNQIEKNLNCVLTTSCGRLFDAAAALLAVCEKPTFEGQAAMQLEAVAKKTKLDLSLPENTERIIDGYAMIERMAALAEGDVNVGEISYAFHKAVANEIARVCALAAQEHHIDVVCVSGDVMQNALLLSLITDRLERVGLKVFKQRQVPSNDGGISLGQAVAAAAMAGRWTQP